MKFVLAFNGATLGFPTWKKMADFAAILIAQNIGFSATVMPADFVADTEVGE